MVILDTFASRRLWLDEFITNASEEVSLQSLTFLGTSLTRVVCPLSP